MRERECLDTLCNTNDGVYIVDADKHIVRWNKGAEKILQHAEAEVLNRNCFRLISGRVFPDVPLCGPDCKIHSSAMKGATPQNFDVLTHTNEGDALWLNVSIVSSANSEEPFVAHIFRDITEKKQKELALDQFLASLENQATTAEETAPEKPTARRLVAARHPGPDRHSQGLSGREIEVLMLLAEGLSTKALAQKLDISHFTARNHIQNILVKLNLHSKAQAVSYAFKKGIL